MALFNHKPVAHMRASRAGRRVLFVFLGLVTLALIGAGWYVLPFVSVVITPKLETVPVAVDVRIDTTLTEPLMAVGNIPGRIVSNESEIDGLQLKGFEVVTIDNTLVAYDHRHVTSLVQRRVDELLGHDFIEVPDSLQYSLTKPVSSHDKRSFTAVVQARVLAYRPLPVMSWRERLPGMSITEAQAYLTGQKGVATVAISSYPNFFAKLSQKFPRNQSSLTFTLDVEGKTSILE